MADVPGRRTNQAQLRRRAVLAGLVWILANSCLAGAADKAFNGSLSTDWLEAANWTPAGIPAAADDVTIGSGKTANLSDTTTINKLTLAGTLTGSGALTVTGLLTWTAGTMSGVGITNANAGLALSGSSAKSLTRTLNNTGAATWDGTGNFSIGTGGVFNNQGSFTAQNDAAIISGGGTPRFENTGAFVKALGTAATSISVPFNNTGSVSVHAGTLKLSNNGTHSGSFDVVLDATLEFSGGTHTLTSSSTVGGTNIVFSAGTVGVPGGYAVSSTTIKGGTISFNAIGMTQSTAVLTLSAGSLAGSGAFVATDMTWTGGSMSGVGTTTASGTLALSGANAKSLTRRLDNAGPATWSGTGNWSIGTGGVFNNQAHATLTIQTDAALISGGGTPHFDNDGTVIKALGTLTTIGIAFNNAGSIDVQSGTLKLSGGGTHTGSFSGTGGLEFGGAHTLDSNSTIAVNAVVFSSGTTNVGGKSYTVPGGTRVTAGTANFTGSVTNPGAFTISNGTANISNSEGVLNLPTLTLSGGTLAGSSTVTVSGPLTWTGGTMSGVGTTIANTNLSLSGTNAKALNRAFNNLSAATWSDPGNWSIGNSAVFTNEAGATFTVQTDATVISGGGTPRFENAGTLVKPLGTSTAFNVPFNNTGTVEVMSGKLVFSKYTQSAGVTRLNGGGLQSSTALNITGGDLEGSGNIAASLTNGAQVRPGLPLGQLDITGNYTQSAAGSLTIEAAGVGVGQFDKLTASGTASLNGTLNLSLINGYVPQPGDRIEVMTFGAHTGDFATATGLITGVGQGFRKIVDATKVTLEFGQENCSDGQDNDGDGLADCADPKCAGVPACSFTPTPTASRTATAALTQTSTPVATGTPTRTAVAATATSTGVIATVTSTATATPTSPATCVGDCNADQRVTINEVLTGVNIALGNLSIGECPVFDANHNGSVEVNELIMAVGNALHECVPAVLTPTPGSAGRGIAGGSAIIADAMEIVPSIIAAVANGIQYGVGGAAAPLAAAGSGAGACPLGGTAARVGQHSVRHDHPVRLHRGNQRRLGNVRRNRKHPGDDVFHGRAAHVRGC